MNYSFSSYYLRKLSTNGQLNAVLLYSTRNKLVFAPKFPIFSRPFSSAPCVCQPSIFLRVNDLSLNSSRSIRTRKNEEKHDQHKQETSEEASTSQESSEGDKSGSQKPPIDPALARKLRIYVLVVAGLSFVTSFLILSQMFTSDRELTNGLSQEHFNRKGITYEEFVAKYLRAGEVQRIIFAPSNARAIAFLHPGAVVDGKPVTENSIVIDYAHNAQQFWADVRRDEADLGLSLGQGVKIDLYQGMTTFRVVELLIGVFILAFLGTQYGRLLRKRILERKQQKSGQQPPK